MELSSLLIEKQNQYVIAWLVYLICTTGFCFVVFRLTRSLKPRVFKRLLQWCLVVLVYTPYYTDPEKTWLVPAFLVGSYEYALGHVDKAESAVFALAIGFGVVSLAVGLEFILRKLLHLHSPSS